MPRRFTKSEVALARRISAKCHLEFWERSCAPQPEVSLNEAFMQVMNEPLSTSFGGSPPWWERAIAEADRGELWVDNFGWMKRDLWDDLLAYSKQSNDQGDI